MGSDGNRGVALILAAFGSAVFSTWCDDSFVAFFRICFALTFFIYMFEWLVRLVVSVVKEQR